MKTSTATPVLETHGLTKRYGGVTALDNVAITLEAGEPIALIGPNGAGKTTLLSLVCGFIRPSAGRASVLGLPVGSSKLSGRVAALPQDAQFDPALSINRQLTFFARLQGLYGKAAKDDVARVLDVVKLGDAGGKRVDELSHGMRKRIALAQALLGKPELVLLDEPTAGIDPPNVKIIRDLIRSESANTTFVISSHNLDELEKLCSHVVYLSEGRLLKSESISLSEDAGFITLRLPTAPEEAFMQSARQLDGVLDVQRQAQGDYLLRVDDDIAVDQALLVLLAEQGWQYKHIIKGRSLEERLYG